MVTAEAGLQWTQEGHLGFLIQALSDVLPSPSKLHTQGSRSERGTLEKLLSCSTPALGEGRSRWRMAKSSSPALAKAEALPENHRLGQSRGTGIPSRKITCRNPDLRKRLPASKNHGVLAAASRARS